MASEAENFEQGCQSVDKRNVTTVRVSPHDNDLHNSIIPIMLFFNSRMLEERTVRGSMIGVVITRNRVSARPPHHSNYKKDESQSFNGRSVSSNSPDHSYPCSLAFLCGFIFPSSVLCLLPTAIRLPKAPATDPTSSPATESPAT